MAQAQDGDAVATGDTRRHGTKEHPTTMISHPSILTGLARDRQAERLAVADRDRLAQSAVDESGSRRDWGALAVVMVALALPFVASILG